MAYTNNGMTNSEISLSMPQEPRGNYRGSNEFIRKYLLIAFHYHYSFEFEVYLCLHDTGSFYER